MNVFFLLTFSLLNFAHGLHVGHSSLRGDETNLIATRRHHHQHAKGHFFDTPIDSTREEIEEMQKKDAKGHVQDAKDTYKKASNMNPAEMLAKDLHLMRIYLMPGHLPDLHKKLFEVALVAVALVWFAYYGLFIYKDDQAENLDRWKNVQRKQREEHPGMPTCEPDVVLVFYNPACKNISDSKKLVPLTTVKNTILAEPGTLPRMDAFLEQGIQTMDLQTQDVTIAKGAKPAVMQRQESSRQSARALIGKWVHQLDEERPSARECDRSFGAVRQALLQDIYTHMPQEGFDVSVFSSVDNDEIFVGISLKDEPTIKHQLQRNRMKLQLQRKVVTAVGVDQPSDEPESSPPLIEYDHRMCENILGDKCADSEFFRTFHGPDGVETIISSTDRIRIILAHFNQLVNLDFAVQHNLLVNWFPAHWEYKLTDLEACWARFSLLFDLSCVQPVSALNDYFGSRVAFLFAWNGLYSKLMLALLPVALLFEGINLYVAATGQNQYWNRGSVMGFGLVLVVWSKLAVNLWQRQQDYLNTLWDMSAATNHKDGDDSSRPDFVGTMEESPVDRSEVILYYPPWKSALRRCVSFGITGAFCVFVFWIIVMWLDLFNGRLNIAANIFLAVLIETFNVIFNWMCESLTIAENHQYQDNFYNSYLLKQFTFQFVNYYSAFFYIAVKQSHTTEGCPNDDCVGLLQEQLPPTLLALSAARIAQVILAAVSVELKLWYEDYAMRQALPANESAGQRSFVERQGKFAPFRIREQIEVTVQLAVTLGFVLLFGAVAPRIVLLCLLVFLVQLRAGAVLITKSSHRTVPRMTLGIGPLQKIVAFLMVCGMSFTGFLLVTYGPLFHGTQLITKLSGLMIWGALVAMIWAGVDVTCPPVSAGKEILEQRREHVIQKVIRQSSDTAFSRGGPKMTMRAGALGFVKSDKAKPSAGQDELATPSSATVPFAAEVERGEFGAIPRLADQECPTLRF